MSSSIQAQTLEAEFFLAEREYGGWKERFMTVLIVILLKVMMSSPSTRIFSPQAVTLTPVLMVLMKEYPLKTFKCACQFGEGRTPCYKSVPVQDLIKYRSNCLELSKDELDLVILVQVHSHYVSGTSASNVRKSSYSSRYFFHDKPIYLKTFLFVHSVSDKRYRHLVEHYRENNPEVKTRRHGNSRKSSHKAASMESVEDALQFIKNTASAVALPLPGRMPNFKYERFLLLPTDMTKAEVHRRYVKACEQDGRKPFSRTKFIELWLKQLPLIGVTKPATDLCWDCQKNSNLIFRSANLSESDKYDRVKEAQRHLTLAKLQREHCNSNVKKYEDEWTSRDVDKDYDGAMHFSFDYAQQVHYPSNALQPGPLLQNC